MSNLDVTRISIDVVIIGAGFSGLAAAIRLREKNISNIVILERADRVGGTWRDALYPGAEVDVPAWLYSLSFHPKHDWNALMAPAQEIQGYIEDVVQEHGLANSIKFNSNVIKAVFQEAEGRWHIDTENGLKYSARTVIGADGLLANASFPKIPGLENFTGQKVLCARWDTEYDYKDKRIGVVGTGASAVQVIPELVKTAKQTVVFQRTPGWVIPRTNFIIPKKLTALFHKLPITQRALRGFIFCIYEFLSLALIWITPLTYVVEQVSKRNLRSQISDPKLRESLLPQYRLGCKRPLVSSTFYPALQQDNCTLVPFGIKEITETGITTLDGSHYDLDCIVFATGYDAGERGAAFKIVGLDSKAIDEKWAKGMIGYKSVNVSGYPNYFWIMGPNAFGHSSELLFIEEQVDYAVRAIEEILSNNLRYIDVKPHAQNQHNVQLQRKLSKTTFNSGCQSWFLTDEGFNGMMFPGGLISYRRQMRKFDLADYTQVSNAPTTVKGAL